MANHRQFPLQVSCNCVTSLTIRLPIRVVHLGMWRNIQLHVPESNHAPVLERSNQSQGSTQSGISSVVVIRKAFNSQQLLSSYDATQTNKGQLEKLAQQKPYPYPLSNPTLIQEGQQKQTQDKTRLGLRALLQTRLRGLKRHIQDTITRTTAFNKHPEYTASIFFRVWVSIYLVPFKPSNKLLIHSDTYIAGRDHLW